jgi:hypothetical protein
MAEGRQPPRGRAPPTAARQRQSGCSPSEGSEGGRVRCMGECEDMATARGIGPFLNAALPTHILNRHRKSLHRRALGSSPYNTGAGSHTSCELTRNGRSQTATRGACNRLAVTSTPPPSPKPAVERADCHAGHVQPHRGGAPLRLRHIWHGGPGPHVM